VLEVALRLHQITGGYTVKAGARRRMTRTKGEIEEVVYEPVEIVAPKDNPKMMELMDIVGGFKKKQGIIWAVYKPEIAAIVKMMRAAGLLVGELHGGIPEADRQPMVDAFQNGQLDWIVGNASTGGMGYTMMASEVNIFYNNTFKMIDRVQAEDRAYGDGQLKSGIWIDIVAEKTVDVAIIAALELKQDLATYVRERITRASKILEGEA
jgi:SNF2 family DNA or RNA helicase